jgi:hypothetical protein
MRKSSLLVSLQISANINAVFSFMSSSTALTYSASSLDSIHTFAVHGLNRMDASRWIAMTRFMLWKGLIGKLKRRMMRGFASVSTCVAALPHRARNFVPAVSGLPLPLVAFSVPEGTILRRPAPFVPPSADTETVSSFPKPTIGRSVSTSILQKDATKVASTTTSALSASPPLTVLKNAPFVSSFAHTPLRAEAFASALDYAHLSDRYPSLVHNIIHGFPIGLDMPLVSQNFLPPNHYKTMEEDQIIQKKLSNEVILGRMSGPFSIRQAECFFGGPFRTAPLAIVPKPGVGPDQWRMVQNLSFRDQFGMSVNDFIDSDDFPTRWGTAQMMADWVRIYTNISLALPVALAFAASDVAVCASFSWCLLFAHRCDCLCILFLVLLFVR